MSKSKVAPVVHDDEWALAADSAKDAAASVGEMVCHVGSAVGAIASQAAGDVGKRADDLTASAGAGIQELADRLSKSTPQEGMLGSASQAVARTVKEGGEYVETAKLSGITEDVAEWIRRNPITAILIATGLGWFVARKLR